MDLQAVLAGEGLGGDGGVWRARDGVAGGAVDGQGAERRLPGVGGVQGDAADGHAVGGAEQDDPPDLALAAPKQAVGRAGDIAGIDVAGVGGDHRLGREVGRRGPGQTGVDAGGQAARVGRVEEAGDAGALGGGGHDGRKVSIAAASGPSGGSHVDGGASRGAG